MVQKIITEKNFGTYVRELYSKVYAGKTVLITEEIRKDTESEKKIDFEGSMEDCIQDLRQCIHHAG